MVRNGDMMENSPILQWIRTNEIKIPEKRLRSKFSSFRAKLFQSSIKNEGILQPIHVVEDEYGVKWLVDGENRLRQWVKEGRNIVPAIVKKGTKLDAMLGSAQHNLLRGKVNPADLSEFLAYLHNKLGFTYSKIREIFQFSEGHISLLVKLAGDQELLEKVRKKEISLKEAKIRLSSSTVKPISSEKPPFAESVQKQPSLEEPKKI